MREIVVDTSKDHPIPDGYSRVEVTSEEVLEGADEVAKALSEAGLETSYKNMLAVVYVGIQSLKQNSPDNIHRREVVETILRTMTDFVFNTPPIN